MEITGLLTKASQSREKTEEAQEKENIGLAVTTARIGDNGYQELNQLNLQNAIDNQFGTGKATVTDNGEGTFTVSFSNNGNIYNVGDTIEKIEVYLYISNADELKAFRDEVNRGNTFEGKYVCLTNDITLDINEEWIPIGTYLNDSPTPNHENNTPFKGTFDGQSYEINGIYINTTDKVQGLFGLVDSGTIKNTIIGINCNIVGKNVVSGVVGYAYNNVNINNCVTLASIKGETNIGGIVGVANSNCIIKNCNNTGNIEAVAGTSGGIVGFIVNNTTIQNCQNNGEIKSGGPNVGGIAGAANGNSKIYDCFNDNIIKGAYWVGGIVGNNESHIMNSYNVKDIISTSIVSSGGGTGGIAGKNINGKIENCYNIGEISGISGNYVGYLSGITQNGYIRNSYSLDTNNINIIGFNDQTQIGSECQIKSSTELKNMYSTLGNSFKAGNENFNNGYPILSWQ